ncbi:hypothetical protein F5Y19DRAFT_484860 [Xylariaceae sp. FL1651]|nr:hypothetical protein F5Y19DRAFT_484860 [Xylariaceae sp. FL1651]
MPSGTGNGQVPALCGNESTDIGSREKSDCYWKCLCANCPIFSFDFNAEIDEDERCFEESQRLRPQSEVPCFSFEAACQETDAIRSYEGSQPRLLVGAGSSAPPLNIADDTTYYRGDVLRPGSEAKTDDSKYEDRPLSDATFIESIAVRGYRPTDENGSLLETTTPLSSSFRNGPRQSDKTRRKRKISVVDQGENDESLNQAKRANNSSISTKGDCFACHFYKKDQYTYYRCIDKSFKNISQLTEHLRKKHSLKEHSCKSCWRPFDSARQLADHVREDSCERAIGVSVNDLIIDQSHMGHCRKWYWIWDSLFPEIKQPDNPHWSHPDDQYAKNLRQFMETHITASKYPPEYITDILQTLQAYHERHVRGTQETKYSVQLATPAPSQMSNLIFTSNDTPQSSVRTVDTEFGQSFSSSNTVIEMATECADVPLRSTNIFEHVDIQRFALLSETDLISPHETSETPDFRFSASSTPKPQRRVAHRHFSEECKPPARDLRLSTSPIRLIHSGEVSEESPQSAYETGQSPTRSDAFGNIPNWWEQLAEGQSLPFSQSDSG